MERIYVIGHVNPDTDSIAAAVGYAWLLRERDGSDAIPARAGAINPQTTWVLKTLGLEPPLLLNDASPRFEAVMRRLDTVAPDDPLSEAWSIVNRTGGVAAVVDPDDNSPVGLITGLSLFNFFGKIVGPQLQYEETRVADILQAPCREAMDTSVPRYPAATRIRDVLNRILREEHNDFLVTDEHGHYLGVARQRDVLNPPRLKLVLVDHNEPGQALGSLEEAQLLEILDHHRLGNISTHAPIRFTVDIVGSTSTLVTERIEDAGLSTPPAVAGMLLAGMLSDTLILTSPTTTSRDRRAAERLARWAFVKNGPLPGETIDSFGQLVLRSGADLETRDPAEIVTSDLKEYEVGKYRFAAAQVEVTNLMQLDEHLPALTRALGELRQGRNLDFALLMVTDVVKNTSRLLLVDEPPALADLPYPKQPDGTRLADGVVSRKKQLLPVILGLLEG
jgi:manganese-dependent inorganic pyrophosphatase